MQKNKKSKSEFNVGDEVFVCDGGDYHGKVAKITKIDPSYSPPRYDGTILKDGVKFHFEKETNFCSIKKGPCDLCGSPEGIIKPPYPVPKYGRPGEIASAMYPYSIPCLCDNCKKLLNLAKEKKKQLLILRENFIKTERIRRDKNHLCSECGGEIVTSGPYMVYEGTYETVHRCTQCKKEDRFT